MKSKKNKAGEIKKCLKKGIPIKDLESGLPVPPRDKFMLDGVPAAPIEGIPFRPIDPTPEELDKYNAHLEQLQAFFTSGDVAPPRRTSGKKNDSPKIVKFNKSDFNNTCTALTASGEEKAKNLILNILSEGCRSHGFRVSPKAADRNKKNQLILDYVYTFLRAYEFLTEKTILSAEEAKERLHPYWITTTVEMFLDGDIN